MLSSEFEKEVQHKMEELGLLRLVLSGTTSRLRYRKKTIEGWYFFGCYWACWQVAFGIVTKSRLVKIDKHQLCL
jgi:hypothetical protein